MRGQDWIWIASLLASIVILFQGIRAIAKWTLSIVKLVETIRENTDALGGLTNFLDDFKIEVSNRFQKIEKKIGIQHTAHGEGVTENG